MFRKGKARSSTYTRWPAVSIFNLFNILKKIIGFAILAAVCTTSGVVLAASHKVRVEDPVLARELAARGGKVIGEYGAFTVLEADDALLTGVDSNRVEVDDDWNLIRLHAQPLDTSTAQVKALRKPSSAFAGRKLHLVQFSGPVKSEWLAALKQSGAQVVSYIPENAYLIYGDAPALARMQSWATNAEFVQWDGEYTHELKVHPDARVTASGGQTGVRSVTIQLIADSNSNPSTVALIDGLASSPHRDLSGIAPYRNIVVSVPVSQLDTIAAQPDVISILPYNVPKKRDERQDQIMAGNLTNSLPTGPGYLAWLASKGFTQAQFDASGFVVDVADSGIDNGTTSPGHFGLYPLGDTTTNSRVAYIHANNSNEGIFNPGGTAAGCDGHGTLNTHIIANYDAFTGTQHQDAEGFSYGVGVCPFVQVGSSVIFDNDNPTNDFTNPDFNTMLADAYDSKARVVNNSWGASAAGMYDSTAQTYDALVRDSEPNIAGNQEMVIVFAAGNDGPCVDEAEAGGVHGMDSPGTAKNVITVGASANVRSLSVTNGGNDPSGNDACSEPDSDAASANDVNCSSSQGPCRDGRMKPDLMAPGIHITGGVPQNSPPPSPTGLGSALDCFNALGVCALNGSGTTDNTNNFFPLNQQFYTESSGTSHSTPAVSGACALIRQYFINNSLNAPSAAMTKAFLMNSARYMTGVDADDTLWSRSQGMGEVDLGMALDGEPRFLRDELQADMFTASGQVRGFGGVVVDTNKPFRVTLAWTDAPGNTTGAAYNNNLNLVVSIGGSNYLGNVFKGQYSTIGGVADKRNNVQSVFLPAGVSGGFVVSVTAANINSEGVPGSASPVSQDFALIVYNATASNGPIYSAEAASYSGLFYEPDGPELGKSGAVTVKTTASRRYSGQLRLGSIDYSFSGVFNTLGSATNVLSRNGAPTLGLSLLVNVTNNDVITGTVLGSTFTANLVANREVYNAKANPASFAGKYTFVFPGNNGRGLPQGDGYGTATVSTSGSINSAISLADGTKVSLSSVATVGGQWPLFTPFDGGQGEILGWLLFSNTVPETLTGDVTWIKSSSIPGARIYPGGFDFETTVMGSAWNSGASPLIGFNSGVVILSGGNLSTDITNNVTVNGSSIVNTSGGKLTLKLNTSSGVLSGSVANPLARGSISFNGVFLQNQDVGLGYSLGMDQSSLFFFGPAN